MYIFLMILFFCVLFIGICLFLRWRKRRKKSRTIVDVYSMEDFPTPVDGVINLAEENTEYRIYNPLKTSYRFKVPVSSEVIFTWPNSEESTITYTGEGPFIGYEKESWIVKVFKRLVSVFKKKKSYTISKRHGLNIGDIIGCTGYSDPSNNGPREILAIDGDTMEVTKFTWIGRLFRILKRSFSRK